jgi:hypothetical protein
MKELRGLFGVGGLWVQVPNPLTRPQKEASAVDVGPTPICLLQDFTEPCGPVSYP